MKSAFALIRKVLIISGTFLAAALVPLLFFIPGLNTQMQVAEERLEGVAYLPPAYQVLKAVQEHRTSVLIYLHQRTPYDQAVMIQKQGEIEVAFNNLAIVERSYGEKLGTADAFMEMRRSWNDLVSRVGNLDAWNSIRAHDQFIGNFLLPFFVLVADHSRLMMNEDPVSFYSAASLIYALPKLTELLGRMQAYGIQSLSDTNADEGRQVLRTYLLNEVKEAFDALTNLLEPILNGEVAFQVELRQGYAAATRAVADFIRDYEQGVLNQGGDVSTPSADTGEEMPKGGESEKALGKEEGISPQAGNLTLLQYAEDAARTVNEVFRLSDYELKVLKRSLNQALDEMRQDKLIVLWTVGGLLAAAFAVCLLAIRRIRSRLFGLQEVSQDLAPMMEKLSEASSVMVLDAVKVSVNMADISGAVEQVGQTARLSIDNARAVLGHAENVVRLSDIGKKSNEAISTHIHRINSQVASIEQIITSLHDQSQAIGSIISSMEELTRQSNLLALNAALEAIKAGDYGKGFDVVAQEINRLAKQSQQATDHIRSILDDIKVSVGDAVSITKQGRESVVLGVKQSLVADQSFIDLSKSVSEARQAAGHIVDSSENQFAGVNKIVVAFKDVKRGSIQNAEKIKKVQQSAQTLQALSFTIESYLEQLRL